MSQYIPVNEPLLGTEESDLLLECISSGWISSDGPFVSQFEDQFSSRCSRLYGVSCSSGTAAIDLAIKALGISEGDEVILPTFTIISCVHAIVNAGAVPVFVDVDPATWNTTADHISAAITPRTVAILIVHIYGLPVDIQPVIRLAERHKLAVIEDAAELIGGIYNGAPIGSFGTISTFSFYPNKHITTGEGGMLLTDDPLLADKARSYRNLCFKPNRRFFHTELGFNYRMTNLQAAIGIAQLSKLDYHLQLKRSIGSFYQHLLSDICDFQLPVATTPYADNLYWVFALVSLNPELLASDIIAALAGRNVGTRPFFYPLHLQPALQGLFHLPHPAPVAEHISQYGLYLPSGLTLTRDQQVSVISSLKQTLKSF